MLRLRILAAGLTLIVGSSAVNETVGGCGYRFPWICEGPAWAAPSEPAGSQAQGRPLTLLATPKANAGHWHSARHRRAHRPGRHVARLGTRHAPGFARRVGGALAPVAFDQEPMAETPPSETIGALVPAWVATPSDGLSAALAGSPSHDFDLVAEWNRAVGEISVVGAVPTETLKSFNDFPPEDAAGKH